MSKVLLPLNIRPPITSYLNNAFPLAILSTDDQYEPWFYSNYIQLFAPRVYHEGRFNFYVHKAQPAIVSPLLDTQRFDRAIIEFANASVTDFLSNCLQRGWYVQLYLDEYFIPVRASYGNSHFVHEVLVYGEDSDSKLFTVLGYTERGLIEAQQVEAQYIS